MGNVTRRMIIILCVSIGASFFLVKLEPIKTTRFNGSPIHSELRKKCDVSSLNSERPFHRDLEQEVGKESRKNPETDAILGSGDAKSLKDGLKNTENREDRIDRGLVILLLAVAGK